MHRRGQSYIPALLFALVLAGAYGAVGYWFTGQVATEGAVPSGFKSSFNMLLPTAGHLWSSIGKIVFVFLIGLLSTLKLGK